MEASACSARNDSYPREGTGKSSPSVWSTWVPLLILSEYAAVKSCEIMLVQPEPSGDIDPVGRMKQGF